MNCLDCASPTDRDGNSIRCFRCAIKPRPRIAAEGRVRAGDMKSRRVQGKIVCKDCSGPIEPSAFPGRRVSLRCPDCRKRRRETLWPIRQAATSAVAKAIESGDLPRPATLTCEDCGRPAAQYDHRDYTKPLQVAPVCRSCNVMRGPADVWFAQPGTPEAPTPGAEAA